MRTAILLCASVWCACALPTRLARDYSPAQYGDAENQLYDALEELLEAKMGRATPPLQELWRAMREVALDAVSDRSLTVEQRRRKVLMGSLDAMEQYARDTLDGQAKYIIVTALQMNREQVQRTQHIPPPLDKASLLETLSELFANWPAYSPGQDETYQRQLELKQKNFLNVIDSVFDDYLQ